MSLSKKIKKYQKQTKFKLGERGFAEDENGRAIINVGAENYDDLYSPYCHKGGDTISTNLSKYLEDRSNCIPNHYALNVRFYIKDVTEHNVKELTEAYNIKLETDIHIIENLLKDDTILAATLVAVGFLIGTFCVIFKDEIKKWFDFFLNIFAWVFVWEGTNVYFLDRQELKQKLYSLYRLRHAHIEVLKFENY